MDNSINLQKPVSLPSNEDHMHRNGNNLVSQNPKLLESTQDQRSFSECIGSSSPKRLKESASDETKTQDCTGRLQKDDTEHSIKPESQVKSKAQEVFKGDMLHDNEAMEHIQASRKSEPDTKAQEESENTFISPGGKIQRGEEVIIAKTLHDIEKSCSKPSRSFTVTLKHPKVKETEQNDAEVDCEADNNIESSIESSNKLSEENKDTHQKALRDTAPQNEHCSGDEVQNEKQNNTASDMYFFEGTDSSGNDSSITNEIDNQQACIQVEIDCNSSEDGYDSESSDYHKELEQNTSSTSTAGENYTWTQDDDNEQFSDTEEDDHRSLQQQHSSIIVKVNEHTKSKISSTKEVFEAKKSIASSEVRAAATYCKGISESVQLLTTDTNIRGGEVRAATADTKLIDTKVKTGTVVTKVKGAEVKVATSDVKGLHAQTGASLDITTKASTTTAGRVELTGA